jgi:hypothetical protein
MRSLAIVVFLSSALWAVSAVAEEIAVPVEYHGRQMQLEGQLQMPAGPGPFPVVIALHTCAGYYTSAMGPWLDLLWQQGYATLRLDSFTARGFTEISAKTRNRFRPPSGGWTRSRPLTFSLGGPMSGPIGLR